MILSKSKIYEINLFKPELTDVNILLKLFTQEYSHELFKAAEYVGYNGYRKAIHYFDDDDPLYVYMLIGAMQSENYWMKNISSLNLRSCFPGAINNPKSIDFILKCAEDCKINLWKKLDYYNMYCAWSEKRYDICLYMNIMMGGIFHKDADYDEDFMNFMRKFSDVSFTIPRA